MRPWFWWIDLNRICLGSHFVQFRSSDSIACYGKLKLLNFASTERKKLDLNGGFANMISTFVILGLFEYNL